MASKSTYSYLIDFVINIKAVKEQKGISEAINKIVGTFTKTKEKVSNAVKETENMVEKIKKRKYFFDTFWGKMFTVMIKLYSIRFVSMYIYKLTNAFYQATLSAQKFNKQLLSTYGYSRQGSAEIIKIIKLSKKYGVEFKRAFDIGKTTRKIDLEIGGGFTEALMKMSSSLNYTEEQINLIIEAFNRMYNSGKVSIDDLNELAENGIYVWETLQEEFKLSDEQLRNIEKSGLDVKDVIKALSKEIIKTSNNEQLKFSTLEQSINNVKNSFKELIDSIMNVPENNIFTKIIKWIDTIIQKTNKLILGKNYFDSFEKFKEKYDKLINTTSILEIKLYTRQIEFIRGLKNFNISIPLEDINELMKLFSKSEEKYKYMTKRGLIANYSNFLLDDLKNYLKIGKLDKETEKQLKQYLEKNVDALISINKTYLSSKKELEELIRLYPLYVNMLNEKAPEEKPKTIVKASTEKKGKDITYIDLLDELLYNIEHNIKDNIDGVINVLNEIIISNKSIGEYDAKVYEQVLEAFNKLLEYTVQEIKNAESLEEQLKLQEDYKKIQEEMLKYVEDIYNKKLDALVSNAEKQAELNKKSIQSTIIENLLSGFYTEQKQIIMLIDEFGREYTKEITTGLYRLKDEYQELIDKVLIPFNNFISRMGQIPKGGGREVAERSFLSMERFKYLVDNIYKLYEDLTKNLIDMFIGNFNELYNNINFILGSGILLALSKSEYIQPLLDPISHIIEVLANYLLPTINDLLAPLSGFLTTIGIILANTILPIMNALMPFIQSLSQLLANILTLIQPLLFTAGLLFYQIINVFLLPLTIIMKVLDPIMRALLPVMQMFAKVIWFVGFAIHGVVSVIAGIINGLLWLINAVLKTSISYISVGSYLSYAELENQLSSSTYTVAGLVGNAQNPSNAVSSGGSSGGNYTTTSQRPLTVNVYVENWFGDKEATRKLALIVKNEFEILGIL